MELSVSFPFSSPSVFVFYFDSASYANRIVMDIADVESASNRENIVNEKDLFKLLVVDERIAANKPHEPELSNTDASCVP